MNYEFLLKLPNDLIQAYIKKMTKEELIEMIAQLEADIEKEKIE